MWPIVDIEAILDDAIEASLILVHIFLRRFSLDQSGAMKWCIKSWNQMSLFNFHLWY